MSLLGAIGAVASAAALSGLSSAMSNKASKKLQNQAFAQSLYSSNTAHQREVEDLKAAGLNPVLSANGGASAPTATAPEYQSPISSALDRAIQTAYAKEELTALHEQNKAMKFENDYLDQYGNFIKTNRMAIDNANVATALSEERNSMLQGKILAADSAFLDNTYGQRKELLAYQHTLTKNHVERDEDLRAWEREHPKLIGFGRTVDSLKPAIDTASDVAQMWLNHRHSARSAAVLERNAETAVQRLKFDVRKYEQGKSRKRR